MQSNYEISINHGMCCKKDWRTQHTTTLDAAFRVGVAMCYTTGSNFPRAEETVLLGLVWVANNSSTDREWFRGREACAEAPSRAAQVVRHQR